MKIINKICIYLLDIFFYIYYEEDNNQELDNDDIDDEILGNSVNEDLNLVKEEDKGQFIFEEFFPKVIPKLEKMKQKQNYNEVIGVDNDLIKFWNLLPIKKSEIKDN